MTQDIRFALRLLRRNPAFSTIAIATLALGMGINTAAFTFFNAFVLRPLPVREPEALVRLNALDRNGRPHNFSIAEYRDIRDRRDVFAGVIALARSPFRSAMPSQGERPRTTTSFRRAISSLSG